MLLALAAFGGERHFWRLTLLTFAIACALAGSVLALGLLAGQNIPNARGVFYTNVDSRTLLVSAAGVYLVLDSGTLGYDLCIRLITEAARAE